MSRAFDLLDLFDHRRPFLPLREVVERSALPKTTVVRLLTNLEARALVSVRPDGSYTLGAGMLRWVRMTSDLWEVDERTRASMRRLVDELGETVNIYVRQHEHRMSIAQEEGRYTVRNVIDVGAPMPLWAGATAKVLLTASPATVDRLVRQRPGLDVAGLRSEVSTAKRDGYAVSHGEREIGATAVSAPIVTLPERPENPDGRVLAALSVSGPSTRLTGDRLTEVIESVVATAGEISRAGLGSVEELL